MESPEIVLVLEDEPQLLKLMARVLERAGYEVLGTSHGDEALRELRKGDRQIAALVIDMAIPPGGAGMVIKDVQELRLASGVVVTSGDLLDPELREILEARGGVFLRKPFVPQALVSAVSDATRAPADCREVP